MARDAAPIGRARRPLRCGEPVVHEFVTADQVVLRVQRFRGGSKGPVLLIPAYGVSSVSYLLDTNDTTYTEYLYEHGYDVWLLDTRWSGLLPSAGGEYTLDEVAAHDIPAAVGTVRRITGADSIQVSAHCLGSLAAMMSLTLGLEGVRSLVASQVTLHVREGKANRFRAAVHGADLLDAIGIKTLDPVPDPDPSLAERVADALLAFYPDAEEPCDRAFCRRVNAIFGPTYDHGNLNEATHDHVCEAFGVTSMSVFEHITRIMRGDHAVGADGTHDYLDGADNLQLPIFFLQGAENKLFPPEGTAVTYDYLRERFGPELYTRTVVPGYAHMDCFIGKDAAADVFPLIIEQLDRYN